MVNKFTLAGQLWSMRFNHKCDTFKSIDLKFAVDQIYSAIFKNNFFFQDQLGFMEEIPSLLKSMEKKTSCCLH